MFEAINIKKKYETTILDNVSIQIPKAKIICLAGANGSGKSTLISIMTGSTKMDSGKIMLDNEEVNQHNLTALNKIGFVPQENSLYENLSINDNILFWSSAYKKEYVSKFFFGKKLKTKVKHLSGGEKKLLSIELSLIGEPSYLIMDEPTAALDIVYQKEIMTLIKNYVDEDHSVFFTSHYSDELILCDMLYILNNGVIVFSDNPKKLGDLKNFKDILVEKITKKI